MIKSKESNQQMSESFILAISLAVVGGFLDAYTYCCRDQVFANAQTGNIVRLGITLANGEYAQTIRYFIPILAFCMGVMVAIYIRRKNIFPLHWRQVILFLEAGIILMVAFIPVQPYFNIIANVLISFLCAMQAETFRKVLGKTFSSTMCTGNLRSGIENLYTAIAASDQKSLKNAARYFVIITLFAFGAFLGVLASNRFIEKAILFTLLPLAYAIWIMADRTC